MTEDCRLGKVLDEMGEQKDDAVQKGEVEKGAVEPSCVQQASFVLSGTPKHAKTSWQCFIKAHSERVNAEFQGSRAAFMRAMSAEWKRLDAHGKNQFELLAQQDRERYQAQMQATRGGTPRPKA